MSIVPMTSDDYAADIKLDPSVSLPESASSIQWISNPSMPLFAATFWDKSLRIF